MPTLVILRHAEAAPGKTDDHARPLTSRGRADAIAAGRALQVRLGVAPVVLASDARRTTETAELAFSAFPAGVVLQRSADLYGATAAVLLKAIQGAPEQAQIVVLVGHNPGISELANRLVAEAADTDRARLKAGLPTAGAAMFEFDGAWSSVGLETGRLTAVLLPSDQS